jgi:hypothetical protein
MTQERPSDELPWPAGAIDVYEWDWWDSDYDSDYGWYRVVTWWEWTSSTGQHRGSRVAVVGVEYTDGRLSRVINVDAADEMTSEQARALAAAVIEAADYLDEISARP